MRLRVWSPHSAAQVLRQRSRTPPHEAGPNWSITPTGTHARTLGPAAAQPDTSRGLFFAPGAPCEAESLCPTYQRTCPVCLGTGNAEMPSQREQVRTSGNPNRHTYFAATVTPSRPSSCRHALARGLVRGLRVRAEHSRKAGARRRTRQHVAESLCVHLPAHTTGPEAVQLFSHRHTSKAQEFPPPDACWRTIPNSGKYGEMGGGGIVEDVLFLEN